MILTARQIEALAKIAVEKHNGDKITVTSPSTLVTDRLDVSHRDGASYVVNEDGTIEVLTLEWVK